MHKIWAFCIILVIFGSLFGQEGAEYLIITHDDFAQTINSLAEWKYMKGLQTKVVKLSEIGEDPSNDDIRNYIITAYNTWDPQPEYVLVVGDLSFLPIGQTSPYKSDNYYADINGDTLADLNLGRFPCASQAQCSVMVAKTLAYERWPYLNDTSWFQKATTIQADTFPTHHPDTTIYYQRDGVAFVCSLLINAGFVQIDTFLPDDNADSVIQALNQGRSYLLYTGHGYGSQWQFPFIIDPETGSLQNGTKLPVIVSWSCKTVFSGTNSLGERWLRVGTTNNPKGAVAYLGTTTTGFYAPYRSPVARNFFRSVLEDRPLRPFINLGKAFNEGRDSLWHIAYPYTTTTMRHELYVEWNLLGDPTLQLWTEVPKSMTVQHPDVIEMDVPIDLVITVYDTESQLPIQDALVTLYKPDGPDPEIYESIITNSEGIVVFENLTVPTSGTMYATVTFQNCVPYQGEIQVYQIITDDPNALAYNGNKHLAREPNTDNLHLVYTNAGNVTYRYSGDGGENWIMAQDIEEGEFPAICLDYQMNPCITWTTGNRLFFSRKDPVQGWMSTSYSFGVLQPSHPCITVTTNEEVDIDTVHILVRLFDDVFSNNFIREVSFPITNPERYQTRTLDASSGMNMITLDFPSIARDYNSMLHATWMHEDTVWYATRAQAQRNWNVWGPQFLQQGRQSDHPFVETYGDSIFVVWQNEAEEEVYRAVRYVTSLEWDWVNLSQTQRNVSLYPVNAFGLATTFVDEPDSPPPDDWYEIYWKKRPEDPLNNISQSPHVKSTYPHTSLKFNQIADNQLYIIWQEGNIPPYEIKCKMAYVPDRASAFFSSNSGNPEPSPYLVARDTFFDNWTIPVDVGDVTITYQFPLEPGYLYKVKTIAYHESSGEWQARIKIDNTAEFLVRYNAHMPETLEVWIPPVLYQDSIVEVTFSKLAGDYAAMGPLFIYRFEHEEGRGGSPGGPMAQEERLIMGISLVVTPNPFADEVNIYLQTRMQSNFSVSVYDVAGRLVKSLYDGVVNGNCKLTWDGSDSNSRSVSQGVYFMRIENQNSEESSVHKVLKIR